MCGQLRVSVYTALHPGEVTLASLYFSSEDYAQQADVSLCVIRLSRETDRCTALLKRTGLFKNAFAAACFTMLLGICTLFTRNSCWLVSNEKPSSLSGNKIIPCKKKKKKHPSCTIQSDTNKVQSRLASIDGQSQYQFLDLSVLSTPWMLIFTAPLSPQSFRKPEIQLLKI